MTFAGVVNAMPAPHAPLSVPARPRAPAPLAPLIPARGRASRGALPADPGPLPSRQIAQLLCGVIGILIYIGMMAVTVRFFPIQVGAAPSLAVPNGQIMRCKV